VPRATSGGFPQRFVNVAAAQNAAMFRPDREKLSFSFKKNSKLFKTY
jgi:hypothetical protein